MALMILLGDDTSHMLTDWRHSFSASIWGASYNEVSILLSAKNITL